MRLSELMHHYRTDPVSNYDKLEYCTKLREILLEVAHKTGNARKAHWCKTFAANLGLVVSGDTETSERGMRMLRMNVDMCDRLFVSGSLG